MDKFIQSFSHQYLDSSSSLKLTARRKRKLTILGLFLFSLISLMIIISYSNNNILPGLSGISISSTFSDYYSNPKQQNKFEQQIQDHQTTKKGKRTIIFPNNFNHVHDHKGSYMMKDSELVKYYVETMEQALDPEDLIYRNRFTYKLPNIPYTEQKIEMFSDGGGGGDTSDSNTDMCPKLSTIIKVEASPAMNKNGDLKKILKTFLQEDSFYYRELSPFFPDLKKHFDEDTIDKHWYQFIGSTVWLEQYGVHLMVSRIIYTEKDQGLPKFSLAYLQVFDRNWKELDNVELIVPDPENISTTNNKNENKNTNKKPYGYKSVLYPTIAPIPVYHNSKQTGGRFYGIEDPRIVLIKTRHGYEEPVLIYNSHHRKILEKHFDNDQEGKINFNNYRSLFIGWIWQTQLGKIHLEELPNNEFKKNEYIKIKEFVKPNNNRGRTEKNWALFINYNQRLNQGFDSHVYFANQLKNLKILKCSILNDNDDDCEWEFQMDDYEDAGVLHGGTELININQLLHQYDYPELNSIKDLIPNGREYWVGFARASLKNCGCGSRMYRPNLIVLMKDGKNYKFAYVSSFVGLGIEILPWYLDKGLCEHYNLIIPNGISSWTIEKDLHQKEKDKQVMDYMAFTISRRDATVDVVYVKGLLKALFTDSSSSKHLLAVEQTGFKLVTNVDCALKNSEKFCKIYGETFKIDQEQEDKEN